MALAKLEANIGSIVVTSKGVFTVESINTAQTKEGTSTSISGHSRSGRFFSIEGEEGTYKVIANPTIEQVNEAYARERQLEQLVNNVHAYEETPIVSRYYSQNPNTKLTLTLITPNAVNGTRAKMGKLERELNALREWVMERYLEYTSEVAAALEAHRNPFAPIQEGATEKVTIKERELQVGRVYRYNYYKHPRYYGRNTRVTYARVYRVTKTRAYVELSGGKKGYIASNPYAAYWEGVRVVIGEEGYPIIGTPKVMPFGTLQEASRYYELTHNPVSPEKLINTTFANAFFPEEGATTPALFGSYYEELVKRINKPGRYHYSEERAESHAEEAVNNAIFEALSEIDKGIMGARQVTRQVENFYAGK